MAARPGLPTEEEIDQMKPLKLAKLLQECGMIEDEIEKMETEEARAELKKRIRDIRATAATRRRPGQAAENLKEILRLYNLKRERLAGLCNHSIAYLPKLDQSTTDILQKQLDRAAKDILTDVQVLLGTKECPILVAG
ncbi:uncharacterized protein LOC118407561 [Branchiostoma floridae]|uniref:Uncharacterized protein LOC118407561 n=1 Tax=Branchiostoma floridae TaxID=7739 RepID=A0A9J7HR94_BRAFL|nr:uncharacterized protein LOC118407561 [Branchiostoma floridae]